MLDTAGEKQVWCYDFCITPSASIEKGKRLNTLDVTKRLGRVGCSFVISVPWIYGARTSPISPEQAALLLEDPNLVYAQVAGLSVSEYLEWKGLEGAVLCREQTTAGRPCRKPIKGGTGLEPADWKALHETGGYCAVHGC
jgi:hypothetical protein